MYIAVLSCALEEILGANARFHPRGSLNFDRRKANPASPPPFPYSPCDCWCHGWASHVDSRSMIIIIKSLLEGTFTCKFSRLNISPTASICLIIFVILSLSVSRYSFKAFSLEREVSCCSSSFLLACVHVKRKTCSWLD